MLAAKPILCLTQFLSSGPSISKRMLEHHFNTDLFHTNKFFDGFSAQCKFQKIAENFAKFLKTPLVH